MGAIDTAKEFVRIGSTAGLSKDVIDLLEKKAGLLAEQVTALEQENTTLLRENRQLKLENENFQKQLQHAQPKADELETKTREILKYIFQKGDDVGDQEIAARFRMGLNVAIYHIELLLKKRFLDQSVVGFSGFGGSSSAMFSLTDKGREYCVKSGMVS